MRLKIKKTLLALKYASMNIRDMIMPILEIIFRLILFIAYYSAIGYGIVYVLYAIK